MLRPLIDSFFQSSTTVSEMVNEEVPTLIEVKNSSELESLIKTNCIILIYKDPNEPAFLNACRFLNHYKKEIPRGRWNPGSRILAIKFAQVKQDIYGNMNYSSAIVSFLNGSQVLCYLISSLAT